MLRKFLKFYRPHWKLFLLDLSMAVMISALTLTIPLIIRDVLNVHLPQGNLRMIIILLAVLFALSVMLGIAFYMNIKWGHVLGVRMEADMRQSLFRHLQKLSFSYFDKTKTGHIMSRLSNDLTNIAETAHHAPEDLIISGLTISGAFGCMFYINWKLALVALIPLPFILAWGMTFQSKMQAGFRRVRKTVADINSRVENSIQGIREVKAYTNEDYELEKFDEVNNNFRYARESIFGTLAAFHGSLRFLIQCYSMLILGGGVIMIHYGTAQLTDVLTFYIYNRFMMHPIFNLLHFTEQFQQGAAAFERYVEIMEIEPDIQDAENPVKPDNVKGGIEFKNVWFSYERKAEDWVLEDVSLDVPAGTTVALVGESGAGKSTLAALLPRFYEVQKGSVKIDGNDVMQLEQRFLRACIGLVQQNVFLFDATVRENIMFGSPEASEEEMIEAAKNANIYDFVMSLPDGFDTRVGEHGVLLSGGQKQRISIARVFLKNPPILIFDEATSALDNESEGLIRKSMEKLAKGRTTIIIAHRLSTIRHARKIYVMRNGRIVEQGSHKQLLDKNGYYSQLHEMHNF